MTNYRLLRVNWNEYVKAFDDVLDQMEDPDGANYDELIEAYYNFGTSYSDTLTRELSKLGNETMEVTANAKLFQTRWAKENGFKYDPEDWIFPIFYKQLETFKPDILYIQGVNDPKWFHLFEKDFRERFPFIKALVGYAGWPFEDKNIANLDAIIACGPNLRTHFASQRVRSFLVYHGIDLRLVERLETRRKNDGQMNAETTDFGFYGITGFGFQSGHYTRYWELVHLLLSTSLEVWGYERQGHNKEDVWELQHTVNVGPQLTQLIKQLRESSAGAPIDQIVDVLRGVMKKMLGHDLPIIRLAEMFPDRVHEPLFGQDMMEAISRTKVTLNRHTDAMNGFAGNMRLFEATAAGTCLLTDNCINLGDLFEADKEVVTFSSPDEAAEKVRYLLDHEKERAAIAEAGRQRVLKDHTLQQRCGEINQILIKTLMRGSK